MKIHILTLFPQMIASFFNESIIKKAQEKGLVEIDLINLRDFAYDKRGSVDDRPYGGGKGMILRVDVIDKALKKFKMQNAKIKMKMQNEKLEKEKTKIILTSPRGKIFNQEKAVEYSKLEQLAVICGHYEGVDERVRNFIDEEISLGDYVMTGGEVAAVAIIDAVVRLIPGVLEREAVEEESFSEYEVDYLISILGENRILKKLKEKGRKKIKLLEYPQYTRPENFNGLRVPKILLSGNHQEIQKWRIKKAWRETVKKRKDLFRLRQIPLSLDKELK